jgi:predicted nucleic acid-binding protein
MTAARPGDGVAADAVFLDTNVLVYAAVPEAPLHAAARRQVDALALSGAPAWTSRQVLREFLAVLTRPQSFTLPVSASVLVTAVHSFERRFSVAEDSAAVTTALLQLLQTVPLGGKQVHDANIVATMQVYGIRRLLTFNRADFARFAHLITLVDVE